MNSHSLSRRNGQRGVGLIEVLVSVLVLAFGMLGLVGLQMFTIKNNQSSLERGMAVVQSHSIIDAMRADRENAIAKKFNIEATADAPTGTTFAEVALAAWRSSITATLGAGASGGVSCDGARCTVTVTWDDQRAGGSATANVTTEVRL